MTTPPRPHVPARPFADSVLAYGRADLVPVLVADNQPGARRVHALYRHYDSAGTLLYVGITNNPQRRWFDHACRSPWVMARLVAWVEVLWFADADEAARTEQAVIARDGPLFNKRRRGGRPVTRLQTYLAAGGPEAGAAALGTLRRVVCRFLPGTTCVSCGPDFEELFA